VSTAAAAVVHHMQPVREPVQLDLPDRVTMVVVHMELIMVVAVAALAQLVVDQMVVQV